MWLRIVAKQAVDHVNPCVAYPEADLDIGAAIGDRFDRAGGTAQELFRSGSVDGVAHICPVGRECANSGHCPIVRTQTFGFARPSRSATPRWSTTPPYTTV